MPYHVEKKLYLIRFDKYIFESHVPLDFWILSLLLVNGTQALKVNPGHLKCISGISLFPANKNLFIILFILYLWNKIGPSKGIWLKGVFIPKLLSNPLASYSWINLDFLLPQADGLMKALLFRFLLHLFAFLLLVFFLHLKQ